MALTDKLTAIADAIRAKTGKTDSMTLAQMPTEIMGITTGGGTSPDVRYVTFMNGDTVLYKKPVAVGDDCVDVLTKGLISTPTKASTAQYNYTYYGWGASDGGAANANILKNITEDKTVYAIFTATVRYYTITWLDDDGVTVLNTTQVAYGTVPSYTPTKAGFMFTGWSPTPVAVTGNAEYVSSWSDKTWDWRYEDGVLTVYGTGDMDNYTYETRTDVPWDSVRYEATAIVIEDGITGIGDYCFYSFSKVTSLTIGKNVKKLGYASFQNCNRISKPTIPAAVNYIGAFAFYQALLSGSPYGLIFADTTTWRVSKNADGSGYTTLSSTDLADTSKAASYINSASYYAQYYWRRV